MKRLILTMVLAAAMGSARQPVVQPVMTQEVSGAAQDQVFASIVGIVANFNITLVVKEACLVKMTSLPVSGHPAVSWTLTCHKDPTGNGVIVQVAAKTTPRGTGVPVGFEGMDRDDKEHVAKVMDEFWQHLSIDFPKALVQ